MPRSSFFAGADAGWEDIGGGARRQILGVGADIMIVRVDFDAGAVGAVHHHPHRQATYVASGTFDVTVGGETRRLVSGDSFVSATEVPHGVAAIEAGTLIDCFTPVREDFLASRK